MTGGPAFGWALCAALVVLLAIAVLAARWGRIGISRELIIASIRAVVQLVVVSAVIAVVLREVWSAMLFAVAMFAVATWTAAGRVGARTDLAWIGVALGSGVLPVLLVIFGLGAVELTGPAIVPIAGIIIGGAMTSHALTGRRAFDALRSGHGQVEAALALGLDRSFSVTMVISPTAGEALVPVIDQTRTVGLVTLPGAFVGVLLGGGSAADAAAAQVLVLIGLLAAETVTVVISHRLIAARRIMPNDVRERLPAN